MQRNFKGPDKWSPVTVTRITGPITHAGTKFFWHHCNVDHLHYCYLLNSDNQESNDLDDWPFSSNTSTTDASSNLKQGHG